MSRRILLGLFVTGLFATSPTLFAQESDDNRDIIELIEVVAEGGYRATSANSATGLSVPLDELPINIPVITSDVLADFQLLSQRDALQFHAAADDKRVRGFNTGEFFRNGFLHLSDTHGYTIERIEVIRGPSAVLNGPVTPGGAINVITKKALIDESFGEVGGYWGFSGDDRDNRGLNVDFNMGNIGLENAGGSTAAFRFVGGFQEDTGFGSRANNESHSIMPSLELRPTDDTRISFEYYQYAINTDRTDRPMGIELTIPGATAGEEVPIALAYDGVDPRQSWFHDDADIEESLNDWSVSVAHQFTPNLLGQVRYYRHSRDFEFGPGNRPRVDIFYRMVNVADGDNCSSSVAADCQLRRLTENLSLFNDIDQATASLAWTPDWAGGSHQFGGGVHLYEQNAHLTIRRPRPSGATGGFFFEFFDPSTVNGDDLSFNRNGDDVFFLTVLDRLEDIEQNNVFLNYQGTLLDDRLNLLLGLTHSDIEIARADPRIDSVAFTTIADNNELLVQAGFVYAVTDAFSVYANYSESQLPDVNDPDFSTAPPVRLGEQAEVGVRFSLFDNRVDATLAYFQVEEERAGETTRSAEADGFELDAS
ncbi:MAG: TonB-dependent receptor, partial [Pseudomonadota bacterium]